VTRKKTSEIQYYLILGGANIARVEGVEYCYLDKTTGHWVDDPFVFRHVSGIGGDADAQEIPREQAQQWVASNCPGIFPEGL